MPRPLDEVQDGDAVAITFIHLARSSQHSGRAVLSALRKPYLELNFEPCQIMEIMSEPFKH